MASETDVINIALREVGAERITSLADKNSKSANVANDVYTHKRDTLLRGHSWNFATVRVKLAKLAGEPVFEFDNAFAVPFDWMRNVSVHDNDAGHGTVRYKAEFQDGQRVILANTDDIWLRYVKRVTDPNFMTEDFIEALVYALATVFAIPLASSRTLRDEMRVEARSWLAAARSSDALGSFPELRPRGSWANRRGGLRGHDALHHTH